jgi:ribosomal-protein-alanine N-acetyltransferase
MEKIGTFIFRKMDVVSAREIAGWQYPPPYDIYNCNPNEVEEIVQWFVNPQSQYYGVWYEVGELIGYRCFGEDARVPGGDYRAEALDMGGGIRPERTGQGLGVHFLEAAFEFARRHFYPMAFRATVATFNLRALRVCERVGYRPIQTFENAQTHQRFTVLMRKVN